MGDDSLILREDGYIRMNFPVTTLTYHSNLNIILVKTDVGGVHVLDVNSGVILQSSCLSADVGGALGVEYVPGADRVFVWDSSAVGARTDYNGVLLLHTALQRPLPSAHIDRSIRLELVLSEAVLLYQCLQSLDSNSIEGLTDFVTELKNSLDAEPIRKGVKAQKWSTVTISLPQSILRLVTTSVVQELKGQNRRIPALAIASAVGQRANELVPCSKDEETRPLMYSEAERKETFKRWPHMDYKWALPARMAQAGFYHQPSPSGDDRAMCFTCLVCLVCWEKSDEPWVEHERHSPNCPFVRGEYTHNVPISVTNATACAVPSPCVAIVSKGNSGEFIASGTIDGKINVWAFDCGLKLVKFITLTPYDSIFSGLLNPETTAANVWGHSLEKDTSKYKIELTAMAFVGKTSQQESSWQMLLRAPLQYKDVPEHDTVRKKNKKSALICAVIVTRTNVQTNESPIHEDTSKALFDQAADASTESVQAMNDQNEAKSNLSPNKMLFLLTHDIHGAHGEIPSNINATVNPTFTPKAGGSKKVCTVARTDDANIYDDIFFQYSDEEPELAQCTNVLIDEHISNVINLNASSSKDDCKIWDPKIIVTKHYKVVPPPPTGLLQELQEHPSATPASVLDFVGKLSQLKSWKSGGALESVGIKLADQPDAVLQQTPEPISHYLMTGPVDISDLYTHQSISKWYEGGEGTDKVKVTTFSSGSKVTQTAATATNTEGFESEPAQNPPDEATSAPAVQCVCLPPMLNLRDDSRITHLIPTEDREHLLVVISTIDPERFRIIDETDNDGDTKMEVDETELPDRVKSDAKAYFILYQTVTKTAMYTLDENPLSYQEIPFNESPVDICLLPGDNDQYSFASVGVDGALRVYMLPDFKILSEKRVPKGQFMSVTYCASVDRLSVATKHGMIYFYAFNNGDKDSADDQDEDEFANIDFDMLQRAPRDEVCGPTTAPVIIANKPELDMKDLETLITLTGSHGTNTAVPYSAVVPGFWCELSPAQRPRSDHQNNRTWRLQNTSSTWDEHFLELTLPYSVSLAHVEFSFSLHSICTQPNLPVIMVTLLKQNLHGIGYKKDAQFCNRSESPIPVIDADMSNLDNPIHSEEYLRAHNAEILAGPLLLSSGMDASQQSGVLTLTSPRLYRARGRTFLIHLKTLFDPTQDMGKGPGKSEEAKGKKFIGCDWLHQISLTVRSTSQTEVPLERQQRIAMLENNTYLNTLCEIAIGKDTPEMRRLALDNIIWVVYVRLQRMRLVKTEKGKDKSMDNQQLECIMVIEKHIDALIRNCILCGDRSIAKKCIRILLITSEGQKQILKPWKSTFELSLCRSVSNAIPYVGACVSPGALRWLCALVQQAASNATAPDIVQRLLDLLQHAASPLHQRADAYQHLLRSRFGLYGLPFERTIFAVETPEVGRTTPVTYANILQAQENNAAPPPPRHDQQLRELLNWPKDTTDGRESTKTTIPWWAQNNGAGVFGLGVSESTPLHVSCHIASDGTKLESTGYRHHAAVVSSLPGASVAANANDPHQQLWNAMYAKELKELDTKHPPGDPDPDSLEDVESTMMDCDPHDKMDFSDDRLFREQEQCGIPWAALVTRPPQLTLLVERMHSGARRYIVLDFGHTVRLTDVIIPSCQDLVNLHIDIWVNSEETDCVKLAAAGDIATKNLVLTDLQPPPLCRYMKITTIGRYGMSAMKCKIPLGWFYGEIANVANVQASMNALNALHQDLSCRFRLATGKLMELLNPYLELYNGNAAHMMAYLNMNSEGDNKVVTAYNECIELQQQLHNCTIIMKKIQNSSSTEEGRKIAELIEKGAVTANSLLHQASTDKLRVITENVVEMLLFFYFQMNDVQYPDIPREWCSTVTPLVWQCGGYTAGALATLVARICGAERWWGDALAAALTEAFASSYAPPTPLDRCLVLVIYMCRKTMFSHWERINESGEEWHGVAHALSARALELVQAPRAQPALTAAVLTTLAAVLDAVAASPPATTINRHSRWDWVSGGWIGSAGTSASAARSSECKQQRRKLHKKLLLQMQELEAARRGIHEHLDEQQVREAASRGIREYLDEHQRARLNIKTRIALAGKRGLTKSECGQYSPRCVGPALASSLAAALVHHMLACDSASDADSLMLCAKVVGRLCALSGGAHLLDPSCILGLARLTVTLPPWPRHALTTLLQDLVEFEYAESPSSSPTESATLSDVGWPGHSRRTAPERGARPFQKPPRKNKGPTVADLLADSFGLPKIGQASKPKVNQAEASQNSTKDMDAEEQLTQVAESDDSDSSEEKLENFLNPISEKESKTKVVVDHSNSNISRCCDARLESAGGGSGGAGEALARRALLATGTALTVAVRSEPPPQPPPPPPPPPAQATPSPSQPQRHHPPLTHTLYDVFRHLALDFSNQVDCTLIENVVSLWLTLNGSIWGGCGVWSLSSLAQLAVPADSPRIRLASDTVTQLLLSLTQLENVSLRCWVLSMQALAWIAGLPLQTEGSTHTMGRIILECEHFVPAIVKFVNVNVHNDGAVSSSELYLSGISIGAGAGAASALHSVLSRVVCQRGSAGALVMLKIVCSVWAKESELGAAFDLQATLLRLALPLLSVLCVRHSHHALPLYESIAYYSSFWIRTYSIGITSPAPEASSEARVSGLLADVVRGTNCHRRAPSRRTVLAMLMAYARKLLQTLTHPPGASSSSDQSQTDESKARHSGASDSTNLEDEKKQQAARHPCLADSVLQQHHIMRMLYKALSLIEGVSSTIPASSQEPYTLKEELYWMVASMCTVAANPSLMVPSLMEYLKKDDILNLSQAMQKLIIQLLDNPEALGHFIEQGGLELAVDKLTAKHHSGPSHTQGLVSSLMNYLKLPPQLINMSTPQGKKSQPAVVETVNGLFNIAPLCTISCGNPTAQLADVLLEGGGTATSGRGACAARRVRAAAWSYHFFNADDASLALTLTLPYAVRLHEVQLQPHLTSLATCPGAVGVEAGCGGTLAPLGAPQDTSGMTFIRLVIARPVIATIVQLRLYKPRDSSNMGLLQLRLLAAPAFSHPSPQAAVPTNNWASVIACCTRGGSLVSPDRWSSVCSAGAVSALCACVSGGGHSAPAAHRALLAAAQAQPQHRNMILRALLHMDNNAYAHAFQSSPSWRNSQNSNGGVVAICCCVRALCRRCPEFSVRTYLQWLEGSAPPAPEPHPALTHTLAAVLWILQSKQSMENLHELITDDLFELVYLWVNMVPESSLLKKSLDAILCSMCYIRPELFRTLLEYLEIPMDQDESMEGLTDDTKVHSNSPRVSEASDAHVAWRIPAQRLFTAARAAMSPAATLALLHSRLPAAVAAAIAEFCESKLAMLKQPQGSQEDVQMTESRNMEHACTLVEWVRMVCTERRLKEWAGGAGSTFWRPLLRLLCHPNRHECASSWQECALFAKLEEKTIRLFTELTVRHLPSQKLFATTLHGILESQSSDVEGISGFTRALILRLVLSSERVSVALRWSGSNAASDSEAGCGAAPPHPALACHAILTLPIQTTVTELLNEHLPPLPMMDDAHRCAMESSPAHSGTPSVLRSASDTAISTVVGAWELSLAAASASKDKRIKDVKNSSIKQQHNKKRASKNEAGMSSSEAKLDDLLESPVRVQVDGLDGTIRGVTSLAQLCAAVPHVFGPHLTLNLHLDRNDNPTDWWRPTTASTDESASESALYEGGCGVLREFGLCGGLALVAARLPRPHAPPPDPPHHTHHHHDLDWVKLDDPYEEVVELGASTATSNSEDGTQAGIPAHALVALGLLLKLPGYAAALLDEGARAVHLLRLLLGVAHTEDGRTIAVSGGGTGGAPAWSLGTLPFRVVCVLLERNPRKTPAGVALRASLLHCGAARLLLACLAVFTHHRPTSNDNSQASNGSTGKSEEKSQLYWAKGTGFGTGSTQQSWNVEQALHRQRTEEEHVTVLLQVLASYMNPGEVWPPEESTPEEAMEATEPVAVTEETVEEDPSADLPQEFLDLVAGSSLVPAVSSYLRNDSVLDMSRHIPLYVCVLKVLRALHALRSPRLAAALRTLPRLLANMTTTTNSYANKLSGEDGGTEKLETGPAVHGDQSVASEVVLDQSVAGQPAADDQSKPADAEVSASDDEQSKRADTEVNASDEDQSKPDDAEVNASDDDRLKPADAEVSASDDEQSKPADAEVNASDDDQSKSADVEVSASDNEQSKPADAEVSAPADDQSKSAEVKVSAPADDQSKSAEVKVSAPDDDQLKPADTGVSASDEDQSKPDDAEVNASDDDQLKLADAEVSAFDDDQLKPADAEVNASDEDQSKPDDAEVNASDDEQLKPADTEVNASDEDQSKPDDAEVNASGDDQSKPADAEVNASDDDQLKPADAEVSAPADDQSKSAEVKVSAPADDQSKSAEVKVSAPADGHSKPADAEVSASNDDQSKSADVEVSASDNEQSKPADAEVSAPADDQSKSAEVKVSAPDDDQLKPADAEVSASDEDQSKPDDAEVNASDDDQLKPADAEVSASDDEQSKAADVEVSASDNEQSKPADDEVSAPADDQSKSADVEVSASDNEQSKPADAEVSAPADDQSKSAEVMVSAPDDDQLKPADAEVSASDEDQSKPDDAEVNAFDDGQLKPADPEVSASDDEQSKPADAEVNASDDDQSKSADVKVRAPGDGQSKPADAEVSASDDDQSKSADVEVSASDNEQSKPADAEVNASDDDHSKSTDVKVSAPADDQSTPTDAEVSASNDDQSKPADAEVSASDDDQSKPADAEVSAPADDQSKSVDAVISASADDQSQPVESEVSAPAKNQSKPVDTEISASDCDADIAGQSKKSMSEVDEQSDQKEQNNSAEVENPTEEDIYTYINTLLDAADLEKTTFRTVFQEVAAHFSESDVTPRKPFIKGVIKNWLENHKTKETEKQNDDESKRQKMAKDKRCKRKIILKRLKSDHKIKKPPANGEEIMSSSTKAKVVKQPKNADKSVNQLIMYKNETNKVPNVDVDTAATNANVPITTTEHKINDQSIVNDTKNTEKEIKKLPANGDSNEAYKIVEQPKNYNKFVNQPTDKYETNKTPNVDLETAAANAFVSITITEDNIKDQSFINKITKTEKDHTTDEKNAEARYQIKKLLDKLLCSDNYIKDNYITKPITMDESIQTDKRRKRRSKKYKNLASSGRYIKPPTDDEISLYITVAMKLVLRNIFSLYSESDLAYKKEFLREILDKTVNDNINEIKIDVTGYKDKACQTHEPISGPTYTVDDLTTSDNDDEESDVFTDSENSELSRNKERASPTPTDEGPTSEPGPQDELSASGNNNQTFNVPTVHEYSESATEEIQDTVGASGSNDNRSKIPTNDVNSGPISEIIPLVGAIVSGNDQEGERIYIAYSRPPLSVYFFMYLLTEISEGSGLLEQSTDLSQIVKYYPIDFKTVVRNYYELPPEDVTQQCVRQTVNEGIFTKEVADSLLFRFFNTSWDESKVFFNQTVATWLRTDTTNLWLSKFLLRPNIM